MAKSPATPAPAATPMTTDIATITSDLVLTSSGIPINIHDLPPASISYLLSYGWAKSLQDAAAGATAKAEAAFATGGDEFTKMCAIVGTTPTEALLDYKRYASLGPNALPKAIWVNAHHLALALTPKPKPCVKSPANASLRPAVPRPSQCQRATP